MPEIEMIDAGLRWQEEQERLPLPQQARFCAALRVLELLAMEEPELSARESEYASTLVRGFARIVLHVREQMAERHEDRAARQCSPFDGLPVRLLFRRKLGAVLELLDDGLGGLLDEEAQALWLSLRRTLLAWEKEYRARRRGGHRARMAELLADLDYKRSALYTLLKSPNIC